MKSFRKGNSILGVHINSIAGKDKQTKLSGPNPLDYLGVSFSTDGKLATMYEIVAGQWKVYSEIDGTSQYSSEGVRSQYWGKSFAFSHWYTTYDWVADKGYDNFASWVS